MVVSDEFGELQTVIAMSCTVLPAKTILTLFIKESAFS